MRCSVAMIFLVLFFFLNANAQELKPKWKKGYYGFSLNREMVIDYQFDTVRHLGDERFLVLKDGLWGVVSADPNETIPCEYECFSSWSEDQYLVSNEGLYGIVDSSGNILWDIIYDEIDHTKGDTLGLVKFRGQWALNHFGVFNYNEENFFFERPHHPPLFPGCEPFKLYNMYKYIYQQIRSTDMIYNRGRVIVQFVIDKNGEVKDPKVIQGLDRIIDKECLSVVQNMPRWKPGMVDGQIVQTMYTLYINMGYE